MKSLANLRPEVWRAQNLNVGTKSQDIAQKLTLVRIGNLKDIASVSSFVRPLVRMPLLAGYPACPFWREFQLRPCLWCARKDAVTRLHDPAQVFGLDDMGRFRLDITVLDGIYGKAAQVVAQVAPAIYFLVVPVVNELLG